MVGEAVRAYCQRGQEVVQTMGETGAGGGGAVVTSSMMRSNSKAQL
jgi:hypothetical protein